MQISLPRCPSFGCGGRKIGKNCTPTKISASISFIFTRFCEKHKVKLTQSGINFILNRLNFILTISTEHSKPCLHCCATWERSLPSFHALLILFSAHNYVFAPCQLRVCGLEVKGTASCARCSWFGLGVRSFLLPPPSFSFFPFFPFYNIKNILVPLLHQQFSPWESAVLIIFSAHLTHFDPPIS